MKKIIFTFPVILALFMMGCGGNKADENSFVIKGKLTNTQKDSIFLEELTVKEMIGIDSSVVSEDGEFYFKVKPKETGFYILRLANNNFFTLLIGKGETVEITADAKQMQKKYTVSGSKGSELIKEHYTHLRSNYIKVDSLSKVYNDSKGSPELLKIKASLDSTYKLIFLDEKNFIKTFIDRNTNSLACIIAVYQQFGNEPLFNVNDKNDFAYFEKIDNALIAAYPDNQHSQDLHTRIAEIKRMAAEKQLAENKLTVGFEAPDFKLETPDGKAVSLSSFKGKFVLIDFWASWCAPCRQENPGIVKLYKKYKDKDFTILGVSIDRDKDLWVKAIKTDKLAWTQVSDLKYWDSPIVKLYNIQGIPYSILLDKEGKILAKGLRGEELAEKIKEVVKL